MDADPLPVAKGGHEEGERPHKGVYRGVRGFRGRRPAVSAADSAASVAHARIALGAVGPTVVRLTSVEGMVGAATMKDLAGMGPLIREAVREAVHPIDDQRSTAEYRREVAAGLVESFVGGFIPQ